MKKLLLYVPLLLLAACGGNDKPETPEIPQMKEPAVNPAPQTNDRKNNADSEEEEHEAPKNRQAEEKVMSLVVDLPEVRKLDKQIRKHTNGKFGVSIYIASGPGDDQEYYSVAVAENTELRLVNQYFIRVYPDMSLRYYDPVEDREMTLKEWRKSKKHE